MLVFKLFQAVGGHEIEQPLELVEIYTGHGQIGGRCGVCFFLGSLHEGQSSRSPRARW